MVKGVKLVIMLQCIFKAHFQILSRGAIDILLHLRKFTFVQIQARVQNVGNGCNVYNKGTSL